jgi:hypothetical protein
VKNLILGSAGKIHQNLIDGVISGNQPVKDLELSDEVRKWLKRGKALEQRIDNLINTWHSEKSRNLNLEAVCSALQEINDFIKKNDELLAQARLDCKEASCPSVAHYEEKDKQLIEQKQKLESMLGENNCN